MKQEQEMPTKVGIMGGTFDPVHYGHLLIAENARIQFGLEKVLFIPTGQSPHKDDARITDSKKRCEMLKLALEDNPFFQLSTVELERNETNYTYRTVQYFRQTYVNTKWYFIMGADSLFQFHTWKHPEQILQNATILAAVRDEKNLPELEERMAYLTDAYGGEIYPLQTPNFSISSHEIRKRIEEGASIRYQLPDSVRNYIEKNHLYCKRSF
ncbi:MAG: nicotinate-nucleotide adenylyltransferase [Lachnospiraceae bacterium]